MIPKQIIAFFGTIVGVGLSVYLVWDSVFGNAQLSDLWGIPLIILLCLGVTVPCYEKIESEE